MTLFFNFQQLRGIEPPLPAEREGKTQEVAQAPVTTPQQGAGQEKRLSDRDPTLSDQGTRSCTKSPSNPLLTPHFNSSQDWAKSHLGRERQI